MDHRKLVAVVSQCPPLWDRSHDKFRDQTYKASLWNKIGLELNSTGPVCREAFKALREKYIREREKLVHYGSNYRPWELLDFMQFLDPYIITRKQAQGWVPPQVDGFLVAIKQDPSMDMMDEQLQDESDANSFNGMDLKTSDFCNALIKLVHESRAVWDRHCKDYHDKPLKDRLWRGIAHTLKSDVNTCTLRWKGLREKYIRQKQKYCEGEAKWEFLDELAFLDSVIQYRKKHWQIEESSNMFATSDNSCALSQGNSDYEHELLDEQTNDSTPNQPSSSTNIVQKPPQGSSSFDNGGSLKQHTPDSTLDAANAATRKRTLSDNSDASYHKKEKNDGQDRTPEQIFGELVAAMLSSKTGNAKNIAMMEIMTILTKPAT